MEDKRNAPKGIGRADENRTASPSQSKDTRTANIPGKETPTSPKAAAFPGAPLDKREPDPGKAFTGFPAKENVITPPVDPMIEQARRVEAAHPAITPEPVKKQTQEEIEADRKDLAARQNVNPKAPGPVSVTRPEWEDEKEAPVKRDKLQQPVVPGMVAMRSNAPQDWRVGTMPAPEPKVEESEKPAPDPKPVQHAANQKKGEGVTYIPKYKKFLGEFKSSGRVYNVGMFDSEKQAVAAIATEKARLYG
jgi:hypothetical protein